MQGPPLILYIPGLKPKPEPAVHREQLFRCLLEGMRRVDAATAQEVETADNAFDIVSWTYDFYGEHRDITVDMADIDLLLEKHGASESDRAMATSWRRRTLRWLFRTADFLPFSIPKLATEELEVHLRDLNRYVRNNNGVGDAAREKLRLALRQAHQAGRRVLLLAHSMGSVIAYDVLWQLSQNAEDDTRVDRLVTMGSPLGQKLIQRRLLANTVPGSGHFPDNIDDWINIAAHGELTAIDTMLANDYGGMVSRGLVPRIDDRMVFNYYHMHGTLNVHAEYGYLVNEVTASAVINWWRSQSVSPSQSSV